MVNNKIPSQRSTRRRRLGSKSKHLPKPSPNEHAFLKAARRLLRKPFAPTLHEIADVAEIKRGSIARIVRSLMEKGYVVKSRKARSLQLLRRKEGAR
jgi:DNA-binding MarR family transcriptional regulator